MALTLELSEPTALAAGCSLVDFSINSGPKLALTVHKVSAIWLAPSAHPPTNCTNTKFSTPAASDMLLTFAKGKSALRTVSQELIDARRTAAVPLTKRVLLRQRSVLPK